MKCQRTILFCLLSVAAGLEAPAAAAPQAGIPPPGPLVILELAQGRNGSVAVSKGGFLLFRPSNQTGWITASLPRTLFFRRVTFGNNMYVAVGGSYMHAGPSLAITTDGHHWRFPKLPGAGVLHAIVFHKGRFIAVGDEAIIVTSTDGRRWQKSIAPTGEDLMGIAAAGEIWVAVGRNGSIITRVEGSEWNKWSHPDGWGFGTVAWTGHTFEARSYRSEIFILPMGAGHLNSALPEESKSGGGMAKNGGGK